jgi:hypothetical protein
MVNQMPSCDVYPNDPDCWNSEKTIKLSTLAQIGLGLGEVIGGLANGEIQDRLATRTSLYINLV